jgi:hypothetical protein
VDYENNTQNTMALQADKMVAWQYRCGRYSDHYSRHTIVDHAPLYGPAPTNKGGNALTTLVPTKSIDIKRIDYAFLSSRKASLSFKNHLPSASLC